MTDPQKRFHEVTREIAERSQAARSSYLELCKRSSEKGPSRSELPCANYAHAFAACSKAEKELLKSERGPNIAIVSAYNDVLSAHQPYRDYPEKLKKNFARMGATAQVAGGVPAMCDGVTQGQPGMELSLFSRDVIALSTAVALSHDIFDGGICLGICDKIVPGLLIGALRFGHLPFLFVPSGPMPSGLSNEKKSKLRVLHAEGKIGREELLEGEMQAYHGAGTCTFYGTANSNQMLMEFLGLHLPGASFENPNTPLREAMNNEASKRLLRLIDSNEQAWISHVVSEKSLVNAVVGLLATGGSTNHTMHLIAIARAAGIDLRWEDFARLSEVVPLLARVYPNGKADVNHFHQAGGLAHVMGELLDGGLLHPDVSTVMGEGLDVYRQKAKVGDSSQEVVWNAEDAGFEVSSSNSQDILRPLSDPFSPSGGIQLLEGNLGRAIVKVSAIADEHRVIEAPARVFESQQEFLSAFSNEQLCGDFVAVVRGQGPRANGMPELHKLTPALTALQNKGQQVALLTDGRMSGASGRVPAAIHLTPEAACGGAIAKLRDGDPVRIDTKQGLLSVLVPSDEFQRREAQVQPASKREGLGRELFAGFRATIGPADQGASIFSEI